MIKDILRKAHSEFSLLNVRKYSFALSWRLLVANNPCKP
jgi:hypothetical protein